MKCENCNERNATFFFEQHINGEGRSHHLCHACAEKLGLITKGKSILEEGFSPLFASHTSMIDEIFGLTGQGVKAKKCEGCGATWQELAKSGKVGCPRCYTTFGAELESSIRSIHGNVTHVGTGPARHTEADTREAQLEGLKKALGQAIEEENFEQAARLRDQIRALANERKE